MEPRPCRHQHAVTTGELLVLENHIGEQADGAGAETQDHVGGIVGESLEIAPQAPLLGCHGERVARQCEMVKSHRRVARPGQALEAECSMFEALPHVGKLAPVDPALTGDDRRQVSIAEQGDALRGEPQRFAERGVKIGARLAWQTVHEVNVQRPNT